MKTKIFVMTALLLVVFVALVRLTGWFIASVSLLISVIIVLAFSIYFEWPLWESIKKWDWKSSTALYEWKTSVTLIWI